MTSGIGKKGKMLTFVKMKKLLSYKVNGLSLLEVLTVLIIIGLTSLVVVRNLAPTVIKVKVKEAKTQLDMVYTLQQTHFMEFNRYSGDLQELGYAQLPLANAGGDHNYQISIVESSNTGFVVRAESITDFDQDGVMDVWEIDHTGKLTNTVPD